METVSHALCNRMAGVCKKSKVALERITSLLTSRPRGSQQSTPLQRDSSPAQTETRLHFPYLLYHVKVPLWPEGKPRMNEQFKAKTAEELRTEFMAETMAGEGGNGITIARPEDYDLGDGKKKVDDVDVLKEEL